MTATIEQEQVVETQQEEATILRTSQNGCYEIYKGPWGSYLRETFDPDANAIVTDEHLKHFELREDIHRIPADLWTRWVNLCFHFVDKVASNLEVSVRILRSEEDRSVYRILVPKQEVTTASVRASDFNESIDITTGEVIESYPPTGWIPVGSSHSHNTMPSFFSGTDDRFELGDPGIHLVVGGINTKEMKYTIASSVVGSGRRFLVPYDKLIDATPVSGCNFHEDVLNFVNVEAPKATTYFKGTTNSNWDWGKWNRSGNKSDKSLREEIEKQYEKVWKNKSRAEMRSAWMREEISESDFDLWNNAGLEDYKDPFHYQDGSFALITPGTDTSGPNIWNHLDSINDYVVENSDNIAEMNAMKHSLEQTLHDIESLLAMHGG